MSVRGGAASSPRVSGDWESSLFVTPSVNHAKVNF